MEYGLKLAAKIIHKICGGIGIKLVDFKLEFGRHWIGDEVEVFLADEISPDTCRLWDVKDERKLDKDRFRRVEAISGFCFVRIL